MKKIEVVQYDPSWPKYYEIEAEIIKSKLGQKLIAIYHVGSTSVPNLCAKPKIDIIAVMNDPSKQIDDLSLLGYEYRGEYNIPLHYGFSKRGDINFNLHAYERGHPEIELNLLFRDVLRSNTELKKEYYEIKHNILKSESSQQKSSSYFTNYTLKKGEFIHKVLQEAGFDRLRLIKCDHPDEWKEYHRIREEQIFNPIDIEYEANHPTITGKNHHHFVLYKGVRIVSVAHVEFLNETEAALRSIATDRVFQNEGYGKELMRILEKWLKSQDIQVIKAHVNHRAEGFYRKLGFIKMHFNDTSISSDTVDMGKIL